MEPGLFLGIGSAVAFGSGDFVGGYASRRSTALIVAAGAQLAGLALLLAAVAIIRPGSPDLRALGIGGVAGLFGGVGLLALYRGLSLGSMGLVAALSAVGSVAIPVVVGFVLLGDSLSAWQVLGVAAAVAAGAMAGGATSFGVNRQGIQLAGLAALGFGLWFVLLDVAADSGELWALVGSRGTASLLVVALALTMGRGGVRHGAAPLALVAAAGVLDVAGNAAFVLATGSIPVGVAAALSGLYPLVTMLLARLVLRDALPALGVAAVGVAVAGIVLISVG